jgi:hypothetical protein
MTYHIILEGNIVDGVTFIGPFPTNHEAVVYATDRCVAEWSVTEMEPPRDQNQAFQTPD